MTPEEREAIKDKMRRESQVVGPKHDPMCACETCRLAADLGGERFLDMVVDRIAWDREITKALVAHISRDEFRDAIERLNQYTLLPHDIKERQELLDKAAQGIINAIEQARYKIVPDGSIRAGAERASA